MNLTEYNFLYTEIPKSTLLNVGDIKPFESDIERVYPKSPVFIIDENNSVRGLAKIINNTPMNNKTIGTYEVLRVLDIEDFNSLVSGYKILKLDTKHAISVGESYNFEVDIERRFPENVYLTDSNDHLIGLGKVLSSETISDSTIGKCEIIDVF